jgi:hypothetical protein
MHSNYLVLSINMNSRSCDFCTKKATLKCSCSSSYFCINHYTDHTTQGINHSGIKLANVLNEDTFTKLKLEVKARISQIQHCKQEFINFSYSLIKSTTDSCNTLIKILEIYSKHYLSLVQSNNFDDSTLAEVKKILNSSYHQCYSLNNTLLEQTKAIFSQTQFKEIDFSDQEEKKSNSRRNDERKNNEEVEKDRNESKIILNDPKAESENCMYYAVNDISLQEKIEMCIGFELNSFESYYLSAKHQYIIQDILFSNDLVYGIVCKGLYRLD